MSHPRFWLECLACGVRAGATELRCPACGGELIVRYDYTALSPGRWRKPARQDLWRYGGLLPLGEDAEPLSLGEGLTPLIRSRRLGPTLGLPNLHFKLESLNPTGSFKDRQVTVGVSVARALGLGGCVTSSSGNAGAATAAYCAAAGMGAAVIVPDGTPEGKLLQIGAFGAELLVAVGGSSSPAQYLARVELVTRLARERGWLPVVTARSVNPYLTEGAKTISYELVDQLGRAPDLVCLPLGGGGLALGVLQGFADLRELGEVGAPPRLLGAQPAGASTIVRALQENLPEVPGIIPATRISGVAAPQPLDGASCLAALRVNGALAEAVDDDLCLELTGRLARLEGIFAEPAGALGLAALVQAVRRGEIPPEAVIVCLITGSGFKTAGELAARAFAPERAACERKDEGPCL